MADVIAADDQILPVIGTPAHQDMDVRIVGVPVIDGDPVQLRSEVALGVGHELARERMQVRHLRRVLRRHGEAEMVAVVLAALGESLGVRDIRCGVEHACVLPVSRDAFALQIGDVLGERRGRKALAMVAHDARHDDDPPPGRSR